MKSLIVYSSQTENTKKLADLIFDTIEGEKEIFAVEEAPSPEGYDFIALGFWLMGGKPDPKAGKYLETLEKGQSLFLFATHGAARGSDHVKNAVDTAVSLTDNADVKGVFTCQGRVNPKVLEKVKQKPEPPVWIGDADEAVSHPDGDDLDRLQEIIKGLNL